jgi:hypothetical protein
MDLSEFIYLVRKEQEILCGNYSREGNREKKEFKEV